MKQKLNYNQQIETVSADEHIFGIRFLHHFRKPLVVYFKFLNK